MSKGPVHQRSPFLTAQLIAQKVNGDSQQSIKVLDIAAGDGLSGIAFAQPNAKTSGVDWLSVL